MRRVTRSIDLNTIAREITAAQDDARQIELLTSRYDGFDVATAYRVANAIHEMRVEAGLKPVGRKIGFTNSRLWAEFGVSEPIWGHMYDTTVSHVDGDAGSFSLSGFAEPKIEPEIVVHLGSAPGPGDDAPALLEHVDWIAHGFEIVQSHFAGWRFQAPDTIADQGLHGALLVGPPLSVSGHRAEIADQLERFTIALSADGEERDTGNGANVLGSPLKAVAHLIAVLAGQPDGPQLREGELLTTGTITAAHTIRPGETWSTELLGIALPGLAVRFAI